MADWDEIFDDIRGMIAVAILGMVGVYVIVEFAATLIPSAPSWLGAAVISSIATLGVVYIYFRIRGGARGGR